MCFEPPSFGRIRPLTRLARLPHFFDLLRTLSAHRIRVRYKQSRLGILWAVLQPLVFAFIFTFDEGGIFWGRQPIDGGLFWRSFIFSIDTMTTVGYGDITPKTPEGKVITICVMLVGIGFATPELLWRVLTAKRWELLKVLCGAGPVSIREASRRVASVAT